MFVIPYSLEDKIFLYQISKKLASSYTRGLLVFNCEQLASWSGSRDGVLSFAGYLFNNFRDYEWKVLKLHKNMGLLYWILVIKVVLFPRLYGKSTQCAAVI